MLMARLMTAVVTLNLNMYVCQITSNFLAVYTGHTCIRIPISLMKIFNESIECRSTGKEVSCERQSVFVTCACGSLLVISDHPTRLVIEY